MTPLPSDTEDDGSFPQGPIFQEMRRDRDAFRDRLRDVLTQRDEARKALREACDLIDKVIAMDARGESPFGWRLEGVAALRQRGGIDTPG